MAAPWRRLQLGGGGRTARLPRSGRSCGGSSERRPGGGSGPATLTTRWSPRRRQPHVDRGRRVRAHRRAVIRAAAHGALAALRIHAQLEVEPCALRHPEPVAQPVVPPILRTPEADPRCPHEAAADRKPVADVRIHAPGRCAAAVRRQLPQRPAAPQRLGSAWRSRFRLPWKPKGSGRAPEGGWARRAGPVNERQRRVRIAAAKARSKVLMSVTPRRRQLAR